MFEEDKIFMNVIKETKDFFYFIKYNSVCYTLDILLYSDCRFL